MAIPPDYSVRVAAVVREALTRHGISTKGIADLTGISRPTLARRLAGGSSFTAAELALIAPHIGMTPSGISLAAEQAAAA
jgi:transcriptional regulator with XRE-family HTH domain